MTKKINRCKLRELESKIRSGKAITIRRISNSKSIKLVEGYKVVYTSSTNQICTFLSKEMR